MCVTFTGCELLCSETVSRQQSSHATLKPKLQVQIKMMVMKDKNAKACGASFESSRWAPGMECEAIWFSQWVWGRPRTTSAEAPGEDSQAWSPPSATHPGRTWHRPRSFHHSLSLLGWRGVQGLRERILKPERPRRLCDNVGKSHQPRGFLPQGRQKVVPRFATELNWNEDKAGHQC